MYHWKTTRDGTNSLNSTCWNSFGTKAVSICHPFNVIALQFPLVDHVDCRSCLGKEVNIIVAISDSYLYLQPASFKRLITPILIHPSPQFALERVLYLHFHCPNDVTSHCLDTRDCLSFAVNFRGTVAWKEVVHPRSWYHNMKLHSCNW